MPGREKWLPLSRQMAPREGGPSLLPTKGTPLSFEDLLMTPRPIALALTICEKIIVEERTLNVTLVSCFTKLIATY